MTALPLILAPPSTYNHQAQLVECLKPAARQRPGTVICRAARPKTLFEVQDWAREQFAQEVQNSPADSLNLGKTCLLIALEDEAAAAGSRRKWSFEWQRTSTGVFATLLQPDLADPTASWHGDASTWSLSRLDALAAEARAVFKDTFDPSALAAPTPGHPAPQAEGPLPPTGPISSASHAGEPGQSDQPQHDQRGGASGTQPDALPSGRMDSSRGARFSGRSQDGAAAAPVPASGWHGFSSMGERQQRAFMRQFPLHTLSAVNTVLFGRHGYMRMREHGDPRQALLNHVMEEGTGCPAALAILYTEICARLGLPLHIHSLDKGSYFVVWPQGSLRPCLDGQAIVFDTYSQGCAFLAKEVSELFELDPQEELLPSSPVEILSGLLSELCRLHWCRAVRCDPRPSMMTDLSIQTANSGKVSYTVVEEMERALAAGERQALLQPDDGDVHMRVVLLLYFTSRYEDALAWLDRHKPVILAAHGMDIPFFDFCDRLQFICDQQRLAARGDTLADIE